MRMHPWATYTLYLQEIEEFVNMKMSFGLGFEGTVSHEKIDWKLNHNFFNNTLIKYLEFITWKIY